MKWKTPERAAWTMEETLLLEEHADVIRRACLVSSSRLSLKLADGSWFLAVAWGKPALRAECFNRKEKDDGK